MSKLITNLVALEAKLKADGKEEDALVVAYALGEIINRRAEAVTTQHQVFWLRQQLNLSENV